MRLAFIGLTGYLFASLALDISQGKQADLIHSFFDDASNPNLSLDGYIYNPDELSNIANINFNSTYYHDGNESVKEVQDNFAINLEKCRVDIGLYHVYSPISKEESDYSIDSFINPIFVHDVLFDCEIDNQPKKFSAMTFMRGNMLGQSKSSYKIYKVVFLET